MNLPSDGLHLAWEPCDNVANQLALHIAYRGHVLHWWGDHYCYHHSEAQAVRAIGGDHHPCSLSRFPSSLVTCHWDRTLAAVDAHIDAQRAAYSPDSALVRLERP